jgi:hypothetical protein
VLKPIFESNSAILFVRFKGKTIFFNKFVMLHDDVNIANGTVFVSYKTKLGEEIKLPFYNLQRHVDDTPRFVSDVVFEIIKASLPVNWESQTSESFALQQSMADNNDVHVVVTLDSNAQVEVESTITGKCTVIADTPQFSRWVSGHHKIYILISNIGLVTSAITRSTCIRSGFTVVSGLVQEIKRASSGKDVHGEITMYVVGLPIGLLSTWKLWEKLKPATYDSLRVSSSLSDDNYCLKTVN